MKFSIAFILLALHLGAMAQTSSKEKKADQLFDHFSFYPAIDRYEKLDTLSTDGLRKLAESYRNTQQPELSATAYASLVNANAANSEDLFQYASVLREAGQYDQSARWMEKFHAQAAQDKRAESFEKESANLPGLLKDEGRFVITHLDINTAEQDFGPAYYKDQVVFGSTREMVSGVALRYNRTTKPFLDLYSASKEGEQLSNPQAFNKSINKKFHEGPASFSADGKFIAFTRNNYEGKSSDGTIKLKIFFSTQDEEGVWSEPLPFKLNSSEYSVGHPALSADGRRMYFSSDMPGGYGGADVYRVDRMDDGIWGEPTNLGPVINTEANELFPFFQEEERVLFFASNGHFGLGGLDIFVAQDAGNNTFSKVLNAGSPLNTRFDDFGIIVDQQMASGYFSSNREGGKGDDDLYALKITKPFRFGKVIKGVAKDPDGLVLAGVQVELKDASGKVIQTATTGPEGRFQFAAEPDLDFALSGTKSDYFDGKNTASTRTPKDEIIADLELEKDPGFSIYALVTNKKTGEPLPGVQLTIADLLHGQSESLVTPESGDFRKALSGVRLNDKGEYVFTLAKEGFFTKTLNYKETFNRPGQYDLHVVLDFSMDPVVDDLSKLVTINPINFDLNKYNIRPDAATELDKIVSIMNQYSSMVVELGAHTDCRGSVKYNEQLSDNRAKASAAYIKERISNPDRIFGKGYGESRLLNGCACEGAVKSTCSEEEHQLNRRTEFKVISTGNDQLEIINKSSNSFD